MLKGSPSPREPPSRGCSRWVKGNSQVPSPQHSQTSTVPPGLLAARAQMPPRGCQLHTETSPWKRLQWRDLSGRNLQKPSTTEGVYEEVILFTHPSIRQRHRDASDVRGHSRQGGCLCADNCSRGWLFRGEHTVLLQLPKAEPRGSA